MDDQFFEALKKHLDEPDRTRVVNQVQTAPARLPELLALCAQATVDVTVQALKECADRYWRINANHSLEIADLIITTGELRADLAIQALGWMAKGDAIKLLGKMSAAWDMLDHAGALYQQAGDEIGWARTRIGRLYASLDLNRVDEALADAERAQDIFLKHKVWMRLMRLQLAVAQVYDLLGDHVRALNSYRLSATIALELGDEGKSDLSTIYNNMGYAAQGAGDLRQALDYYQKALELFMAQGASNGAAIAQANIASIGYMQGHYRSALPMLHDASIELSKTMPLEAGIGRRMMVDCYLFLSRYAEARRLARQVISEFSALDAPFHSARTLIHLATAEAEIGHYDSAQTALTEADALFRTLNADNLVALVHLRRGQIALRQNEIARARVEARTAAAAFETNNQQVNYASAILLESRALFADGELEAAKQACLTALRIARECNLPSLRYSANLLMGQLMEAENALQSARRRYQAAALVIERVQHDLTLTLRPDFLEDKGEALRSLMRLDLYDGRSEQAFENLERSKSQVLLGYLTSRESLRWSDEPRTHKLINELNLLREEHEWLFSQTHGLNVRDDKPAAAVRLPDSERESLLQRLSETERRMRAITEQLYLYGQYHSEPLIVPTARDIQRQLDADTLLIEFYTDGSSVWAFTLDQDEITLHPAQQLDQSLAKLEANLRRALQVDPQSPAAAHLTQLAKMLLQRLYNMLITPLLKRIEGRKRLVIVPYGMLHYLPFNMLYDGQRYLIEQVELVVLPSASLLIRKSQQRGSETLVFAHSSDGLLTHTAQEAEIVSRLFGGTLYREADATRNMLQAPPGQILHIAAHGEHRIDQPDLSYIQLADGQLYADDLLQLDLSYELVTLSCCETGRTRVAPGDELIGLGRGFLYGGAGALVASLWPVSDARTLTLMEHFYHALAGGARKDSALREAQSVILQTESGLHPAYWGAFQLIGDPAPLSSRSQSA